MIQFTRLSSRPSLMVDWVVSRRVNESCYVGSLTRRGLALAVVGPSCLALPLKPQAISFVMCLSNVEGGGLFANGQI